MPLKLRDPRPPKTPNYSIRGTYLGVYVERTAGTPDKKTAGQILKGIKRAIERGEYAAKAETAVEAKRAPTFAEAALAYFAEHEKLLDETKAYLRELATNVSPNSLAVIKSEVYRHWSLAMESAFRDADGLMQAALTHPDATEGVKSFTERRAPRFQRIRGEKP